MRLEKIDPNEFADFIDARFAGSGVRPEDGLGAAIVELAENVPYDVQRLAHETWDDVKAAGKKTAGLDDLHAHADAAARRAAHGVRRIVAAADAAAARRAARAGARGRPRAAVGGRAVAPPPARHVDAFRPALAALVRQDIITKDTGRYVTVDSLYREWVARKTY